MWVHVLGLLQPPFTLLSAGSRRTSWQRRPAGSPPALLPLPGASLSLCPLSPAPARGGARAAVLPIPPLPPPSAAAVAVARAAKHQRSSGESGGDPPWHTGGHQRISGRRWRAAELRRLLPRAVSGERGGGHAAPPRVVSGGRAGAPSAPLVGAMGTGHGTASSARWCPGTSHAHGCRRLSRQQLPLPKVEDDPNVGPARQWREGRGKVVRSHELEIEKEKPNPKMMKKSKKTPNQRTSHAQGPLQSPSPSAAPTTAAPMRPLRTPRWGNIFAVPPEPDEVFTFNPGDPVEVLPNEPGLRGAHFAAVVVGPSKKPHRYIVKYDAVFKPEGSDNPLREAVLARTLRPRPPPHRAPAGRDAPAEHAAVDALLGEAWWLGVALGGAGVAGKVRVCFPETREVMEFDASDIRPHLEWVAGSWRSPNIMPIPKTYTKGTKVEVSKLEDSSVVAWLPAVVAKTFWKKNLLVEYTVSKGVGTAFSEIVDVKHVRPCRPTRPQASSIGFRINDDVEAFQGDGWWLGVITNYVGLKYTFKSAHSGVEVQLSQKLLRLRYDWVGGVWKQKSQSTTLESGPCPPSAASIKKRKTRVDGLPDPAASRTKKYKSPKLGPSKENNRHESSSKEIYPDLEKRPLRDAPRPDDQNSGQAKPAPQPEPTPAPAQRSKVILKLSLPMNQPAAAPGATVSPPTRESDAEKNKAVQNTVTTPIPEVETCGKSPAKSLLTPLDVIIEEMKGCREQWLKTQSQLDHSATKAKELEGQVSKLRAASETDAQHLREMMDKQASLEQRLELKDKEIKDLKKKLVDLGEQMSYVEAELPRGAVMAASHALGVLKNHLPGLDMQVLSKGYACTPAEAQALANQARPIVEPFVKRLGLSVVDPFFGKKFQRRKKSAQASSSSWLRFSIS